MQLDQLQIVTRVRSAWSSIDLGIKYGRLHWLKSVTLWLVLALPCYFLCLGLLNTEDEWLAGILVWWFKPFFERPILYRQSRELFSQSTSIIETLKDVRYWLFPGLLAAISYRRFSPSRSFLAPVLLLEGLKGSAYAERRAVLSRQFSNEATWLTVVLVHFEGFFEFSVLLLFLIIAPELVDFNQLFVETSPLSDAIIGIVSLFVMASIAPFYVAAGFMLYISRRIDLEGWDIEINFRNWVNNGTGPARSLQA